ncbi:hypothetical protein FKP32DRAFT_1678387 [Trametes sanguinea]|nr:hypothetical protein FKP32DRAFT_1678387 [Trametes sanguinea]
MVGTPYPSKNVRTTRAAARVVDTAIPLPACPSQPVALGHVATPPNALSAPVTIESNDDPHPPLAHAPAGPLPDLDDCRALSDVQEPHPTAAESRVFTPDSGLTTPSSLSSVCSTSSSSPTALGTAFTTSSSLASSPVSPEIDLALKVEKIRQEEREEIGYLACDVAIRDNVAWVRDGRSNLLVSKADAQAAAAAKAAFAASPDSSPLPPPYEPLTFTVIGQIADDNFFMRTDGNFGHSTFGKKFSATTLTCALLSPSRKFTGASNDFAPAMANLQAFMAMDKGSDAVNPAKRQHDRVEVQGATFKQCASKHIRLRHAVFAERPNVGGNESDDDDSVEPEDITNEIGGLETDNPHYAEYSIKGWPTHGNKDAEEALKELSRSYDVVPLNAYDVKGNLIPPSRYHLDLRGATVVVSFTAKHYNIFERAKTHKDVYCFDIEYMRILVPGASKSRAAGGKRMIACRDPREKGKRVRRH